MNKYQEFLEQKKHISGEYGFEPLYLPDFLFDFQKSLVTWSTKKGRSALFADCGMGKTAMQLVWAQNIVQKTNGKVLILTPLAVAQQTVKESEKFGIEAERCSDGKHTKKIVVTNYERLHYFDPADFIGCVCDESSILKRFAGATQAKVTRFINKMPYRLLATATAAPNDWIELGTSSEALGELSNSEMLSRFFRYRYDKGQKQDAQKQAKAEKTVEHMPQYYQKLAFRISQTIGQWRLKNHATEDFWRWVCSWARACRKPSDLGFSDDGFILPPLTKEYHISTSIPREGMLFALPAFGRKEELEERRENIQDRCELIAKLANHDNPAVIWCHLNNEADLIETLVKDGKQICGSMSDEEKIERFDAFLSGDIKKLILKPKIGAFGLNWQHCNHVITFASHSYEQLYQSVRRCWRFGQKNPVKVDIVASEGEVRTVENMERKERQADEMFSNLVSLMNQSLTIKKQEIKTSKIIIPTWIQQ